MASVREIFKISGPVDLTAVDWKNPYHRRSVAASLVQGVTILECDRQQKRQGPEALAPPWWSFFHFQLIRVLVDDHDLSIFGAVYEFKFPPSDCNNLGQNPPRYVVAFRGTMTKPDTRSEDLKLDLQLVRNRLQQSTRFQLAMQTVQNTVSVAGAANVWLAGHSLGSAMALLAGKNMVMMGWIIETYLFNPPFASLPIERIRNEKLKHRMHYTSSVIKAGIAASANGHYQMPQKNYSFAILSGWIPYLFVNPSDPISAEYIGYFEHREKMVEMGKGAMVRIATQNSLGSLLSGKDSEPPLHLLPSAYLTVNLSASRDFKEAHGIHQWMKPNLHCESKLHQFR